MRPPLPAPFRALLRLNQFWNDYCWFYEKLILDEEISFYFYCGWIIDVLR